MPQFEELVGVKFCNSIFVILNKLEIFFLAK